MDISEQPLPKPVDRDADPGDIDDRSRTVRWRIEEHFERRRLARELVALELDALEVTPPARPAANRNRRCRGSRLRNLGVPAGARYLSFHSFEPESASELDFA